MPHRIILIDYSAKQLEQLRKSMRGELTVTDVAAEGRFRKRLQEIADCCRDMPDVMTAYSKASSAAVFAFASPTHTARVSDLERALDFLGAELQRVRKVIQESLQ